MGWSRHCLRSSGILQRAVVAGHGCAERTPCDSVAGLIQAHQRRFQAAAFRQQIRFRHVHVLQRKSRSHRCAQGPLAMNVVGLEAGASVSTRIRGCDRSRSRLGPDDGDVGDGARGDPHLSPLMTYSLPTFLARVRHAAGIRSEIRLSQAEAAELFTFLHGRQPCFFLFVATELVNWIHAEARLHAHKTAHAGVAALELLRHEAVFHVPMPAQP